MVISELISIIQGKSLRLLLCNSFLGDEEMSSDTAVSVYAQFQKFVYHPRKPLPFIPWLFSILPKYKTLGKQCLKMQVKQPTVIVPSTQSQLWLIMKQMKTYQKSGYLDPGKTQVISLTSPMCKKEL